MPKKEFTLTELVNKMKALRKAQNDFYAHTNDRKATRDTAWWDMRKALLQESKNLERQLDAMLADMGNVLNELKAEYPSATIGELIIGITEEKNLEQ
jgi:hypothetical protein